MDTIFVECFGGLKDPRMERTKKHLLIDIIALAICGVMAGAQSWEEIEDFGEMHEKWFKQFLTLPNGIPSHDTISRVFSALNPKEVQECSLHWLKRIKKLISETVIPIDGKTLRRSGSTYQKALHVINAWSCANGISLGQLKVDGKSNEITAVPEILKQLFLKGALVTLDAMGCQEETVAQIVDAGADYVVALKGNQGGLHEQVKDSFDLFDKRASKVLIVTKAKDEIDGQHGRIDQRKIEVMAVEPLRHMVDPRWKKFQSMARVTHTSEVGGQITTEQRFYISSIPPEKPSDILCAIRSHWQIENCLHWSLDVIFREDDCRIRNENAALNMSWLRKFALGLLKNETSFKRASIRRKQLKVWADPTYLLKIFQKN